MISQEDIAAMADATVEDFWNLDMSEAPLGRTEVVQKLSPKQKWVDVTTYIPEYVIVANAAGLVTRSRWLPETGRWEMFTKEDPPIAWMMWPKFTGGKNP